MNHGGVQYAISNSEGSSDNWHGTPGTYSTDFEANVAGTVEHFDVYGEVQTLYSQVYWTRNLPVNLPPEIVNRFNGSVMAITGYEIDQVIHTGPMPNYVRNGASLGGFSCYPDCSEGDVSIPSYHAYNHHYFAWLTGKDAVLSEAETPTLVPNPTITQFETVQGVDHGFPTNIVFKENPGGEFRKSYHGYPSGFAQLLHSPSQWVVEPMQIDTHNRNYNITQIEGYKPWFLPKTVSNNMTDEVSGLNPLIECPCTDRITKSSKASTNIIVKGSCRKVIDSEDACKLAVEATGAKINQLSTVIDPRLPSGCILQPNKKRAGLKVLGSSVSGPFYNVKFNKASQQTPSCGNTSAVALTGIVTMGEITIGVEHNTATVIITLTGPSNVWFGVGFNAEAMKDLPYSIIVDGNGQITERKLADHGPGSKLADSVNIVSNTVVDNVRTVVMSRPVKGASKNHYSFQEIPGDLPLISAVGNSVQLSYHKSKTGSTITLLPTRDQACVCPALETNYLTYMDDVTLQFGEYNCEKKPRSDMANFGDYVGREGPNMACHMNTYHGGLQCCRHSWLLTDRDQDNQIPKDQIDTYYLKWRYYFQEYKPAINSNPPSHKHIHHWVFLIDEAVNDYEEDNVKYGEESIGKITAKLQAKNMGLEDTHTPSDDGAPPVPTNFTTITPLVMTPHCHGPSCIRQELWNADSGEILCNMTAAYGQGKEVFDESGYIAILPCIFGYQQGLQFPFSLTPETNLTAVKYFNNTYRHLGQMAQWTGLMVYDTDPY